VSNTPDAERQCFLVEWYRRDLALAPLIGTRVALDDAAAALSANGHRISVQLMLAARSDDVLFSVFDADCADTVARACRHAGWAADRITADVGIDITPTSS
jgi:hypothetical protein